MKKFFEEFKAFAMRGNVVDLAVGVVIGGAFGKITTSLVNDIIMPVISLLTGGISFESWKLVLKEAVINAAGEVEKAEIAINFGNTVAIILDFIIIAFAVFCIVKALNSMHRKKEEEAAEEVAEAPAEEVPAAPTSEELLVEIRDLLKERQ